MKRSWNYHRHHDIRIVNKRIKLVHIMWGHYPLDGKWHLPQYMYNGPFGAFRKRNFASGKMKKDPDVHRKIRWETEGPLH